MKRLHYLVSMLTVLSFGACQNEDDFSQRFDSSEVVVSATLETESNSRTSLESEKVYWEENDALSVFLGNTTMQNATIIKETMEDTYAQFKITAGSDVILGGGTEDDQNYFANVAYYPYGEDVSVEKDGNNYVVSAVLPETQNFKNNSFGTNAYPMVAVTDGLNFGFKNIAGLIHIPLKGTATIVKVTVSSQSHKLAGKYKVTASADSTPTMEMESDAVSLVTLDCGEGVTLSENEAFGFDFVLPVGEYEGNDLTFTFYDNNNGYMEFVAANADKVVRSKRTMFSEKTYEVTGYDLSEDVVAWIGKETYTSISSAVEASQANDVINVKPGTHNEIVDVKGGKNVTIQPANKGDEVTIAGIAHESNGTPSTIVVKNITLDNTLQTEGWFTGTGNNLKPCVGAWGGNFTFENCKFIVSGESKAETGVMTWWTGENDMTLKFDGCTFDGKNNHTSARAMQIYGHVDLTIENCTFNTYKDYSLKYVGEEGHTATFSNNKVYNTKYFVELGSSAYPGKNCAVYFKESTLGDGIGNYLVANDEGQTVYVDGEQVWPALVAEINGKSYESLAEALKDANSGTTVKVKAGEYTLPKIADGVTIEGEEGVVFTGTSSISGENVTIKNVVFSNPDVVTDGEYRALTGSLKNATFENCHFDAEHGARYCYTNGEVVFNDCTFGDEDCTRGVHFDGGSGTVTFNRCKLYGFNALGAAVTKVTFNECEFLYNKNNNVMNMYSSFEYNGCKFNPSMFTDCAVDGVVASYTNCSYTDDKDIKTLVRFDKDASTCKITFDGVTMVYAKEQENISSETLNAALEDGGSVLLTTDVEADVTINMEGGVLDGNNKSISGTLTDYSTPALNTTGGTIQNLSIVTGCTYSIASDELTEDLCINNVTTDKTGYGINLRGNGSNYSLYAEKCTFKGWSSFTGLKNATFTECNFGKGEYWVNEGYADVFGGYSL